MAHSLRKLTGLHHAFATHQLCDLDRNEDHSSPYHTGLLGELNEVINVKYLAPDQHIETIKSAFIISVAFSKLLLSCASQTQIDYLYLSEYILWGILGEEELVKRGREQEAMKGKRVNRQQFCLFYNSV